MKYTQTLLEAAREILEGRIKIAPVSGFKKEVTPREQKVLSTILNTLPNDYEISNAKYFDSGNKGIAFETIGETFFIIFKAPYMGKDDLVRGEVVLQQKGQTKPFFRLAGPNDLNKEFPSTSDYSKIARWLNDMVTYD
jgi:hypothetical protein